MRMVRDIAIRVAGPATDPSGSDDRSGGHPNPPASSILSAPLSPELGFAAPWTPEMAERVALETPGKRNLPVPPFGRRPHGPQPSW